MLINLSNHPNKNWQSKQKLAAKKHYGKIIDIPFPKTNPEMKVDEIIELAHRYAQTCIKEFANDKATGFPNAVHVMGEMTFTYQFVHLMSEKNILCIASTTNRKVTGEKNGEKISKFEFVAFRPYKKTIQDEDIEYGHGKKHLQKTLMFFIMAGLCLILGSMLYIIASFKYSGKGGSLAATTASLLSMQKIPGLSLIVISVLGFSWLIDYIRDFLDAASISFLSLAGALFSFFLLYLVACIVNYLEKHKLQQLKMYYTSTPVKTLGLILTLSTITGSPEFEKFKKLLNQQTISKEKFLKFFKELQILKSSKKLDRLSTILENEQSKAELFTFFDFIAESPLYPMLSAIFYHLDRLKYIWILTSKAAKDTSWNTFVTLFNKFISSNEAIKFEEIRINNTEDINEISYTVNKIYDGAEEKLNIEEHEITSDITGGLKSISSGIILACVRSKRRVQYLEQNDFQLQQIDVNVRSIPNLFDEMIEQIELIRAKDSD